MKFSSETLLSPLILLHDLCLFFRGEVVLNVEVLADLLNALVLDNARNLCAREFEQWFNI